jgi:amino acid permease
MSKSTLQTAIALANSMVGTSFLVLPVNYLEKGIIQNTIGAVTSYHIFGSSYDLL